MSNIEEDKERLMKSLNYELDKIMTRSRKVETATEILNLRQPITYMFLNLLAEREQDKKRIKEFEEKLLDMIEGTKTIKKETTKETTKETVEYIKENYIPVQKVKDLKKALY